MNGVVYFMDVAVGGVGRGFYKNIYWERLQQWFHRREPLGFSDSLDC